MTLTRREFVGRSVALTAGLAIPYVWTNRRLHAQDANSRLRIAAIGVGGSRGRFNQGGAIARRAARFGDMVAVCDVDSLHMEEFNNTFQNKLQMYRDYRELLEKVKPDVVTIGTPDHWHVPIALAALQAGCHVYCEKPLTLTIAEGITLRKAVQQSGRVFQVGTQQRSQDELRFLKAIAMVQSGRLGKNVKAYVAIGGAPSGGPFPTETPPEGLDWDMWVGPAPAVDYCEARRRDFRWFFEYSGGKITDWGAHHIDIAQWALGFDHSGPVKVSGTGKFPPLVPDKFNWKAFLDGHITLPNGFNTATEFSIDLTFANGAVINVRHEVKREDGTQFDNGILFEGDEGRIFVNRGRLSGKPVEDLTESDKKELDDLVIKLYKGKQPGDHMRNFFECIATGEEPISDVATHHRTMTSCHLCNIAMMLGRDLTWNPDTEEFVGDEQASALKTRAQRSTYLPGAV